jgi:hypothetical protein
MALGGYGVLTMQVYLDDILALARGALPVGSNAQTVVAWDACEDLVAQASYADLHRFLRHLPEFGAMDTIHSAEGIARSLCEDAKMLIERDVELTEIELRAREADRVEAEAAEVAP